MLDVGLEKLKPPHSTNLEYVQNPSCAARSGSIIVRDNCFLRPPVVQYKYAHQLRSIYRQLQHAVSCVKASMEGQAEQANSRA
jgi:hypothetical protein